jgi:UDP-N-acetylmuramate: L-alanyl-gamma-D-glutamyl-meso-diaminopimelate ligase
MDFGNVISTIDPTQIRRIHLIGVGGTGMGSFAGMLKAAGFEVSGSDENVYPPMSDMLAQWGIRTLTPYAASNLTLVQPDLVIMGNVIRQVNVEAVASRELGLPTMSFPAALGQFFLKQRHSMVVAGTHGKTTTSALLAHVLVEAGLDPSFLVGGVTQNYAGNYRLGAGPQMVVEGDEYDTAYFDKGPKFLHYQAKTLILTSVEFDHADIYRDLAHYESGFAKLIATMPAAGTLTVSAAWPNAVSLAQAGAARVVTYGVGQGQVRAESLQLDARGAIFDVAEPAGVTREVVLPVAGRHNVENAMGVWSACRSIDLSPSAIAKGFATFRGVKRRQEERGEVRGVLVLDDFAHHPTAVRETVQAVVHRYPGRRVLAVFEPRSNTSRRNIHQHDYVSAFDGAGSAFIKVPERHDKIPQGEGLDVKRLAHDVSSRGVPTQSLSEVPALVEAVTTAARAGDVVLVMSNGSFGGLIPRLLSRLAM